MSTSAVVGLLLAAALLLFVRRTLKIRALKRYRASDVEQLTHSKSEVLLLDVRTAGEHGGGAIAGSINIPLQALRSRMGELEKYRGQEIVCYCQTGSRSVSAAILLQKNGFRVAHLDGGIAEWNFLRR